MNKQMLEELLKIEKQKSKKLLIALVIISLLFMGMTIFAFSEFEIGYEDTETTYEISQDADTQGDNSEINQSIDLSETNEASDNFMATICGTIIVCVAIITLGAVIYGKSKSKRKKDNSNKKTYD